MRKTLAFGIFAFGAVLAACGGGGKSGVIPTGPISTAPVQTPSAVRSTRATVVLHIPATSVQQARTKRPFYISSSTQSVGILVAPASAGTPSPLPTAQVFPVSTPSPCASAAAGGETCTFTVVAPIGNDFFIVSTYATAGPSSSTLPLSIAEGEATVSLNPNPNASPLSFALNAIAATVTISVPSPDPGNTPNTQVFTAGVPASPVPLTIIAKDANNEPILSDPTTVLANAVTILVSPPPDTTGTGGIQLGLTPQCGGSTETGAAVSIACAADFNNVTLSYTGSVSTDASNHIIDNVSIVPVAAFLSSPAPANVVLQSNVISYPVGPSFNGSLQLGLLQPLSNGSVAFLMNNGSGWGIGTFMPSSGALSAVTVGGQASPAAFAISNDLTSVWIADGSSGNLYCWPSIGAVSAPPTATVTPIAKDTFPMSVVAAAIDGSGNLWYVGSSTESGQMYAGHFPITANCGGTVPTAQVTLNGDNSDSSPYLATFQNGIAYNSFNSDVFVASTSSSAVNGVLQNNVGGQAGGVAVTTNATVYSGFIGSAGTSDVESMLSPYTGPMTTLTNLVPTASLAGNYTRPRWFSVLSNTGGAADRIAYSEQGFLALGVVDSVQSSPVSKLIALPNANNTFGTAFAKDGSIIIMYGDTGNNLYIGRALLTKTWSAPVTSLSGTCQGGVFTVDQLGANSGPFTITLSPSLSPIAVPGTTAAMFMNNVFSPTTGSAVVTDANGRSETYPISYTPNGGC
jgi:hypothetical protein